MSAIQPGTAGSTIALSVVLPSCGRMDLLDRCLDSLTRQSLPGALDEVIVVDDEPSRNTRHLVAGWRARTLDRGPRLVYLPNSYQHGPAAARNLGWRSAPPRSLPLPARTPSPRPDGWRRAWPVSPTRSTCCAGGSTCPGQGAAACSSRQLAMASAPPTAFAASPSSSSCRASTSASSRRAIATPTSTSGCWLALTARLCRQRLRGITHTAAHVADVVVTSALIPPLAVFWPLLGAIRYRVRFS